MTRRIFLDPDRGREFEERGYTVLRLLSEEQAVAARARLSALLGEEGAARAGEGEHCRISYELGDDSFKSRAKALAYEVVFPRLERFVQGFRPVSGGFFVKPPGAIDIPVHRDWNLTEDAGETTFTAWLALDRVTEKNGALRFVPGSHRLVPQISCPGMSPFFHDYPDLLAQWSVPVAVEPGEAIIFHTRTIHWSPPNRADTPRPALHLVCIPRDARHVVFLPDRSSRERRFEIFDLDQDEILERTPTELAAGARPSRSLGFIADDSREVSREECRSLLAALADPK